MAKIQVFSEIGKLKKVILHHPGRELKNITPELMEEFLFDEVPYVNDVVAEHDQFGKVLRDYELRFFIFMILSGSPLSRVT